MTELEPSSNADLRYDLLEYVRDNRNPDFEDGWYVTWRSFRSYAINRSPDSERRAAVRLAKLGYQSLYFAFFRQQHGLPNGSRTLRGTHNPRSESTNYTGLLIEPFSLINTMRIIIDARDQVEATGLGKPPEAPQALIESYALALQPETTTIRS